MRLWILGIAASLLAVPAMPVTAQTTCPCTVTDTFTVSGDTIALAIETGIGGASFLTDSRITLEGPFATAREDAASAAVTSDGFSTHAAAVTYLRVQTQSETVVSLGDDSTPASQEIELFGPSSLIIGASMSWIYDGIDLQQGRWVLILSIPEATSLSVDVDLTFDSEVTYERGPATDAGLLAAPDDQTGGAQVIHGDASAAVAQGAQGQAPTGTRGYGLMFGDASSTITGLYGIDGPGSADQTVAAVDSSPPFAFVVGGPGSYAFEQDVVVSRDARVPGPVAVFLASPVSF